MDVVEALKKRRSIRLFKDKPIPKEVLKQIVDVARFAASARNVQPWEFVVITKQETLKKIANLAENGRFLAQAAACVVVFCSDTKYYLEDGCAATENILIAATAFGIGSCWIAGDKKPYSQDVNKLLAVPQVLKLISIIALGFAQSENDFRVAEKRGLNELLHWEKF